MKILQLCKKFPYPVKDGESLAILNLGEALVRQGAEVFLLAMNTRRHEVRVDSQADSLQFYSAIRTIEIDNRIKPWDAFFNLFSKQSYHISRFIDAQFKAELITLLKEHAFDLVQLETLYLTPYIPIIRQHSNAKIALRSHNVEFEIWERVVKNTPAGLKKWYLAYLTRKLKQFEISQLDKFDLLVAISERDQKRLSALGCSAEAVIIPIGVNSATYQPKWGTETNSLELSFIGSLDWVPNIEGLKWFLDEVWPKLKHRFPETRLHIAGRNTPHWVREMELRDVFIHGEVPDARTFINSYPMMVVPLLSGSGMRVKIIEGMALGRVVLTTSIGLEGIPATQKKEVIIADTPEEFLNALEYLRNPEIMSKIGQKARKMIEEQFDQLQIGQKLLEVYERMTMTKI